MTSNWSYFSFTAIEWNPLFDEVNEPSYAMDEFMLVREEHIVANRYEEQQDERSALPSSYSIQPAVRSFFLDKLFYISPLSLLLLLRTSQSYEVYWEQNHIFSPGALFIFFSG